MVGVTARGVCRSVGAVAADGEDGGSGNIGDALTGCEGQLLIPSAEALSGQMNDGFAAGDESEGLAVSGMTFQNIREEAACLPRFTGEPVRQVNRFIPKLFRGIRGSGTEFPDRSVDVRLDIMQLFRGLLLQEGERFRSQGELILLHHRHGIGTGASVGVGGAAGNAVEGIAENIAEYDAEDPDRFAGQGEASALDGGEALADAVHLHDVRTAGQHLPGNILQLFPGNQGQFKEGTAAA